MNKKMLERLADKWDDRARDPRFGGQLAFDRGKSEAYREVSRELREAIDATRSIGK